MNKRILLALSLLMFVFSTQIFSQTIVGNQQVISVPSTPSGTPANALLSLPDDYNSGSQTYPLIVFLHGWGEAGTDINKLITTALPQRIAQGFKPAAINPVDGKLYKFIVVSPQAPDFSFQYGHVKVIMADILKKYRVDQSRIYITGLSAGGYGTWSCMSDDIEFTKSIAAIAPISSMAVDGNRPNTINNAGKTGVAVWSICGTADDKWPIAVDYTNRVNAVNPAIKAKLTGLPGVGHSAWNEGYDPTWKVDNMNLYEWLLQYSRGNSTSGTAVTEVAKAETSASSTSSTTSNIVAQILPVINAGNDVTLTLPNNSVVLQGSGTLRAGQEFIKAQWSKVSGPSQFNIKDEANANPTVYNLVPGVYEFELAVLDNFGAIGKDYVKVTVNAAVANSNKVPVANAGKDITITLPANSITLSADGSSDVDGYIAGGTWSKISGPSQSAMTNEHTWNPTFSNLVAGVYQVELYLYDDKGAEARDVVQITVNNPVVAAPDPAPSVSIPAPSPAPANNCKGRRIVIAKGGDNGRYISGKTTAIYPGDTLVLKAANNPYSYLSLENLYGTASCPIVIINEGGQVQVAAMAAKNCQYLKFTGSGSADQYGFYMTSATGAGTAYSVSGRSSNIEMERSEIYNETYMAWVKHEADCQDSLSYPNWYLDNISFHDNKGSKIGQDALYFGSTSPNGMRAISCNGVTKSPIPMRLSNIKIYNNIIDNCGRTAIQLSGGDKGENEIYNNKITNVGFELNQTQGSGIISGGDTKVYIHDNYIRNTFQNGIFILGSGLNRVENNDIDGSGYLGNVINSLGQPTGILVDTRATVPASNTLLLIRNNKLGQNAVLKGEHIIVMRSFNTYDNGNIICNNTLQSGAKAVNYVAPGINWSDCAAAAAVNGSLSISNEVAGTNDVSLQLYPNPASDVVRVKFSSANTGAMKVKIFDVLGKLVQSSELEKQGIIYDKVMNISSLRSGQYIMKMEFTDGNTISKKFIKL
jgi:hypothetical protein